MKNNQVEGIFSIETPGAIARKVDSLAQAFAALAKSYPKSKLAAAENKSYQSWSKKVLASTWERLWATSVLPELDEWKRRYTVAYDAARAESPAQAGVTAPSPTSITEPVSSSPWFWPVVAGFVGLSIGSIALVLLKR